MSLCGLSWDQFHRAEAPKKQKVLSDKIAELQHDRWLAQASPRAAQTTMSGSTADKRPGAGDWLRAVPLFDSLTLLDDVYRFAIRLRVGLAVADAGDTCSVFLSSLNRTCGRPLTPLADHAPGCAKAARLARHNDLRDWWTEVIKEAGGHALPGQLVTEYAPHAAIVADVRVTKGAG